jgi:hypothetical protein
MTSANELTAVSDKVDRLMQLFATSQQIKLGASAETEIGMFYNLLRLAKDHHVDLPLEAAERLRASVAVFRELP